MRILALHAIDETMVPGAKPSQRVIDGMGALVGESMRNGVFVDGAGLVPGGLRLRLTYDDGRRTIERMPFAGRNELVASLAHVKVRDEDEALHWADRFAAALGHNVEIEIGQVTETWDLGLAEKPPDAPLRVLLLNKANAASESGVAPSPRVQSALNEALDEARAAGVLQASLVLSPSRDGRRVISRQGRQQIFDGPFAESKELIAGFSLLELPSLDEAVNWTQRFAEVLGGVHMELRPIVNR